MEASALAAVNPRGLPLRGVGPNRRLAVTTVQGAAVVGVLAYAAHSVLGFGGHASDDLFENWLFNGLLLSGAVLCLLRALWSRVERLAWLALAVGLGCWTAGEILFTVDPGPVSAGSFPSASDYLWLVFYPAAFLTLGLLVRARVRHFYPSLWLDGAVGGLALAAVAAEFVLPPIVAGTGGSVANVVGDLVYPLGDLLLLVFIVALLGVTAWRPGRVLGIVALGFALGAVADVASLYSSATGGSGSTAIDFLWPASAVVLGWGAWQPARPSAVINLHGMRLLVFPVGFALAAVTLLALRQTGSLHAAAYILAVLTIVGTIARMVMSFAENLGLVDRSRHEALTDPLTGLGNRRRLLLALEDVLQSATARAPWALLLFDLNGFKLYNDTFGHPAGDALLARLAVKLDAAVAPAGESYRLGGDEFCVLARVDEGSGAALTEAAVAALSEHGEGFSVSTAYGRVTVPQEAEDVSSTLRLADQRLYADKRSRPSSDAPDQLRNVLMQVLAEHQADLPDHLHEVGLMARTVGRALGIDGDDLDTLVMAAELHDVGKIAIPDSILQKPDALEPSERAVIERHTQVGQRILSAAAAMAPAAELVRASHEHYDGHGYPDHRAGKEIPLGARVIAICDAFHAMTCERPYRRGMSPQEAVAELRRGAGTQFDPEIVEMFCSAYESGRLAPDPPTSEEEGISAMERS